MNNFDLLNSFFSSSSFGENFTAEEEILCSLIFREASDEVRYNNPSFQCVEDARFAEQIEATKENLAEILHCFEEAAIARKEFLKRFPDWGEMRLKNIGKLRDLADAINTDRFNCNVSKITGGTVGAVAGAALAGSIVFPPATPFVAIGAGAVTAIGGAVTFFTSVTETALLKKCVNEAQAILDNDQEEFVCMRLWFKRTQELIDAMEKIMSFSVLNEIWNDLKITWNDFKKLLGLKNGKLHSMLKNAIKMFIDNILKNTAFAELAHAILLVPVFITFFFMLIILRKNNHLVFSSVIITHRIVFGLMKIFDFGGDIGMLIYNLLRGAAAAGAEAGSKAAARVIAHGVFAGIGVALDVANVVISSIDIHQGSVSKHAEEIKYVANKLEEEHKALHAVYKELHSCSN